ncbi:MAG: tetratricopeptide repeat protein [Prochloraceae cyanobacterium]
MKLNRELYTTGNKKLVLADFNKLIKHFPDDASVYISRGWFYRDRKKWKLALFDFNKAIKLSPNLADGYLERGLIHHKFNEYDRAGLDYQKVLELEGIYLLIAIINIGLIAYEKGFKDEAVKQWQKALQINNSVEAQLALAVAEYMKGDTETAFEIAETALKRDLNFASLSYLQENLWGEHLRSDTAKLLSTHRMQNFILANS